MMKRDKAGNSLFELGDVCRLLGSGALWVPFMQLIERRGAHALHEHRFNFVQYPLANNTRVESRNSVSDISIGRDSRLARKFWKELGISRAASDPYEMRPERSSKAGAEYAEAEAAQAEAEEEEKGAKE